jgi:uncharacterized protein (DUF58 family)
MISDFMSPDFEKALMIAAKKHDLVAMQVYDMRDADLPDVGWVKMKDAETGQTLYVDTASVETRLRYNNYWRDSQHRLQQQMAKNRVDMVSIRTDEDYVKALITLFRMRG